MRKFTLLKPRWILTVNAAFDLLEDHALLIEGERIRRILPADQIDSLSELARSEIIELPGKLLMPGLINAHSHAAMSLLRGLADDLPLMQWLSDHIWPAESKHVDRGFIEDGVRLAVAEMLRSGTTCFNDMYFFPDVMARVCQQMGMRAVAGLIVIDFPTVWAQNADEYLSKAITVNDEIKEYPLISAAFAPHAPYTVSDAPLERIAMLSSELDLPVHMHVHETRHEVDEAVRQSGLRPLQRLDRLGLLNPGLIAVHMTELEEMEIERLAETGVKVIHCPESNLKLASGFCPVARLQQAGITVALGSDGAASNNDLDLFGEMRCAALLAKGVSGDAAVCNAETALRMATIEGARALGLDEITGSIEEGKQADLIAIDFDALDSQPLYNPVSQLVYALNSRQVSDVWVAGRRQLAAGRFTDIDPETLIARAREWRDRIADA
jgi:5-methylthioadenosine/S-adenosylhomocysteine deaminase